MPDVHFGMGATVGSVVPTEGAIIPAAVGVDIGCGMVAVQTDLAGDAAAGLARAAALADREGGAARPHRERRQGRSRRVGQAAGADGSRVEDARQGLRARSSPSTRGSAAATTSITSARSAPATTSSRSASTRRDHVWFMLHSGSRGVGNRIGQYFIELAKNDMKHHVRNLPDQDLAYLREGTSHFDDYVEAVGWAQRYAMTNRQLMMDAVLAAAKKELPPFELGEHRGQLPPQLRRRRSTTSATTCS